MTTAELCGSISHESTCTEEQPREMEGDPPDSESSSHRGRQLLNSGN